MSYKVLRRTGIIPACAGSTRLVFPSHQASWDHPRMCGEHADIAEQYPELEGSSPHVRGAPENEGVSDFDKGIIPACAGSTAV